MKNRDQINRLVLLVLLAMWILCAQFITATVVPAGSQDPQKAEEAVKPLIVMITSQFADEVKDSGAGIIFGKGSDRLYIATANHVVRKGKQEARTVQVEFKWLPGEAIEAKLLSDVDPDLDLAVLNVENVNNLHIPDVLRFDQLGDPSSLKPGDAVYLIGNPQGQSWRISVTPDNVLEKPGNLISFETTHIAPGHSGGALLSEKYEVVGMIKTTVSSDGVAVNIQNVLDSLTKWGYPVNLEHKAEVTRIQPGEAPPVEVPNFSGLTEAEARRQLSGGVAGLSRGEITYQDSNKTFGTVIDQSPAPRSRVQRGTAVNLVIARPRRPPPPVKLPMIVEIESLLPRMKASAGELTRQEMAGFGPGWGANAQVFWRPPPLVGVPIRNYPHVRFSIDVAEAGTYGVTLVHTQAPDYGNARVFVRVRGTPRGDLAGYAPTVRTARVALGDIQLDAGVNEVVVTVLGKAAASTGFFVGLDRIELMRR